MPLLLSDDVDDDEDCKIGSVAPFSSESSDLAFSLKVVHRAKMYHMR